MEILTFQAKNENFHGISINSCYVPHKHVKVEVMTKSLQGITHTRNAVTSLIIPKLEGHSLLGKWQ